MADICAIASGRMVFGDTDGHVVFDTEERLMTLTDRMTGSIGLSGYTATETNASLDVRDIDTLHDLGAINASADVVRGSLYVTTAGGDGTLNGIGWFNAGGTYVHYFGHSGPIGGPITTHSQVTQIAGYTFKASGGHLYLRERVMLKATDSISSSVTFSVTMSAPTLSYNLFCGLFV